VRFHIATLGAGEGGGLIGGIEIAVHREDPRAFLCEPQHSGTAIAQGFSRALSGADDDGDFVLETHGFSSTRMVGGLLT
jgi:hypothetical protein